MQHEAGVHTSIAAIRSRGRQAKPGGAGGAMRLFVAIKAPGAWRRTAEAIQRQVPEDLRSMARLVDPGNMHVTLRFIGDVDEAAVSGLDAALAARMPPVEVRLRLGHVGTFGAPGRTSAVWLGIEGDLDGLRLLHGRGNAAVEASLGRGIEERGYTPHLTLARVRNRVGARERRALAEWARTAAAPEPEEFVAREVVLVRSRLGGDGPHYEAIATYS